MSPILFNEFKFALRDKNALRKNFDQMHRYVQAGGLRDTEAGKLEMMLWLIATVYVEYNRQLELNQVTQQNRHQILLAQSTYTTSFTNYLLQEQQRINLLRQQRAQRDTSVDYSLGAIDLFGDNDSDSDGDEDLLD
jgi:hypothetical protein